MAVTLDTLTIDLKLNASSFQSSLDGVAKQALRQAAAIERRYSTIFKPGKRVAGVPKANLFGQGSSIRGVPKANLFGQGKSYSKELKQLQAEFFKVKSLFETGFSTHVNDDSLTDLNKHLSKKQRHYKEVQNDFSNPLDTKVDIAKLNDAEKILEKIASQSAARRELDPIDRRQIASDSLSRVTELQGLPFTGVLTGFFERFGEKLTDFTIESTNDLFKGIRRSTGGDSRGVGDFIKDQLASTTETLSLGLFNREINIDRSGGSRAIAPTSTNIKQNMGTALIHVDKMAQDLVTISAKMSNVVEAQVSVVDDLVSKQGAIAKPVQFRQQVTPQGREATTTQALAQAMATANYFKSVYQDFKLAQDEYKKIEKTLSKFKPGDAIPEDLGKKAARSVDKLKTVAKDVIRSVGSAQTELKALLDRPELTDDQRGAIKARLGNLGRYKKQAARSSEVAGNRMAKIPVVKEAMDKKASSIAKDTVAGIVLGVEEGQKAVNDAGKKLGKSLEKGTKKSLDIQSPSRVFKAIGKFVNEGLLLGLKSDDPIGFYVKRIKKALNEIGKTDINQAVKAPTQAREASRSTLIDLPNTFDATNKKVQDALSDTKENLKTGLSEVFPELSAQLAKLQNAWQRGVVPDPSSLKGQFARGNALLVSEYQNYAATVRRNAYIAAKAGDEVAKEFLPTIQVAADQLIDSQSAAQDIQSLKTLANVLAEVKRRQNEVSSAFRQGIDTSVIDRTKASIQATLVATEPQLDARQQAKVREYSQALQKPGGLTGSDATAFLNYLRKLAITKDQIDLAVKSISNVQSKGKVNPEDIKAIIKNMQAFGIAQEKINQVTLLLSRGKLSKGALKMLESMKQEMASFDTAKLDAPARKMVKDLINQIQNATQAELAANRADIPFQGAIAGQAQGSKLLDRARLMQEAGLAKERAKSAKAAKDDLEARRQANRARRAQQRAEKGLGTEGDIKRASRRAEAKVNRAMGEAGKAMGFNPAEMQNVMSMMLPAILSGGTIMSMMTPLVAGITPAIIPMIPSIIAGMGIKRLITPIIAEAGRALQTVEPIKQRLELVGDAGGTRQGGEAEIAFATEVSRTYGLDLETTLQQYSQLALAARRTRLEGEPIRELFEGIAASLSAQKLPAADASLVMMAYSQIISKGKVSMEELRQQLGEKFPMAMGIFADALGVSIPELNRLVSSGSLLAEDVMPKVAKVLKRDFADAAKESAGGYIGAVNKVNSAKFEFASNFADSYGALPIALKRGEAGFINALNDNFTVVNNAINTGIISLAATVGTAASLILSKGKVADIAKIATSTIKEGFTIGMRSISPFLMVAFADLLDDIFDVGINPSGNQATFLNNMVDGFTNMFYTPIDNLRTMLNSGASEFVGAADAFPAMFEGIGQGISNIIPEDVKDTLSEVAQQFEGLGQVVGGFFGRLGPGVVQLTVMYIMFQQIGALAGGFVAPQIAKLKGVMLGYFDSLKTSLLDAKARVALFNNVNITTGGLWTKNLKSISLGYKAATAAQTAFQMGTNTLKLGVTILKAFSGELMMLAAAYAMLMFSGGDQRMPLVEDLDKNIKSSIERIGDLRSALAGLRADQAKSEGGERPDLMAFSDNRQFRASGLQLDPLKLLGEEGYKSDQLELAARARGQALRDDIDSYGRDLDFFEKAVVEIRKKTMGIQQFNMDGSVDYNINVKKYQDSLEAAGISAEEFFDKNSTGLMRTEKHFLNVVAGVNQMQTNLEGLADQGFEMSGGELITPDEYNKGLDKIRGIDAEIEALQAKRVEVGLLDTDQSKNQLGEIDEQLRALFQDRTNAQLEVSFFPDTVKAEIKNTEALIKSLRADTAFPFEAKLPILKKLTQQLAEYKGILEGIEATDIDELLAPASEPWKDINKELQETIRLLEVAGHEAKVLNLERQNVLVEQQLTENPFERNADVTRITEANLKIDDLQSTFQNTNKLLEERKKALRELLTVTDTERNPENAKVIADLKKQIRTDEKAVAKLNLDINKQRLSILKAEERLASSQIQQAISKADRPFARIEGQINLQALNDNIDTGREKLRRSLLGLDSSLVGAAAKLNRTADTLINLQDRQAQRMLAIEGTFDGATKQWFLDNLGRPVANFADALNTLTKEEIDALKAVAFTRSNRSASNPIGDQFFKQISEYVQLTSKVKKTQADLFDAQAKAASDLKSALKGLSEFNNQVKNNIREAANDLASLELDLLGKKLENNILEQLKPGTSGVFRDFGSFLTDTLADLVEGESGKLDLAKEAEQNAESLKNLREKYAEVSLRVQDATAAFQAIRQQQLDLSNTFGETTNNLQTFSESVKEATSSLVNMANGEVTTPTDLGTQSEVVREVAQEQQKDENGLTGIQSHILSTVQKLDEIRKSFSSGKLSHTDLAFGKGYDPSRFEGSIPGVTPGDNKENWEKTHAVLEDERQFLRAQLMNSGNAGSGIPTDILEAANKPAQKTNESIEKLASTLNEKLQVGSELLSEDARNRQMLAADTVATKLRELTDTLSGFKDSLNNAQISAESLADEFGIQMDFGSRNFGRSEGEIKVEAEMEGLRNLRRELFDSIGKTIGEGDILDQTISEADLRGIDTSNTDFAKFANNTEFAPLIEQYRLGTVEFADVVNEIVNSTDDVRNQLETLLPMIQAEEDFRATMDKREITQKELDQATEPQQIFASEFETDASKKAAELFKLETKIMEQRHLLNAQQRDGLITAEEYNLKMIALSEQLENQGNIIAYNNSLWNDLGESLSTNIRDALGAIVMEGENIWGSFRNMAIGVLDDIANKALDIATTGIMQGIFGSGGAAGGTGLIGAIGGIFGFNTGGEVGANGVTDSITSALGKESGTPVLAALHVGEQVLTDLNGDAQYFRALKASGAWNQMKAERVGTYNRGGMVGNYNRGGMMNSYNFGGQIKSYNSGSPTPTQRQNPFNRGGDTKIIMNVTTPDVGGFRRSEKQLLRRQEEMLCRAKRRYS